MSALVRKEIRLLLPAWIVAMLLVTAPVLLSRLMDADSVSPDRNEMTLFGLAVGCILLGLAGFGRELSSRTFSQLLAQPRPRREFWRAKVGVLFGSLIPLGLFLGLVSWQFVPSDKRWEIVLIGFITACVAVTGGLWTTLLFRQIIASFWISVLLPFAIIVTVMSVGDEVAEERTRNGIATVLLLAYSVAGYLFARWQFRHAQDTAWTGGDVSLPSAARWLPWVRSSIALRKTHPIRALLGKEFQFQQVNFLLAGLLLAVQVAALLLQRYVKTAERSTLEVILQNFWWVWIVMPMLVGCGAVAEERRLGTLEPQLCLPVARAWQFTVKVFVTLVCGIMLGALVPVAIAFINPIRDMTGLEFAGAWTLGCVCLALISFYASSLTHQLLQAFGATVGIIVAWLFLTSGYLTLFSSILGQSALVFIVGATLMLLFAMVLTWRRLRWIWVCFLVLIALSPLLGKIQSLHAAAESKIFGVKMFVAVTWSLALSPVALTLALAAQNSKHTQTSLSLWWRNSATWLGCFILTGVLTALVYNRVWELAMRLEPVPRPLILSGSIRPAILPSYDSVGPLFVLIPDGRLWAAKVDQTASTSSSTVRLPDGRLMPAKVDQTDPTSSSTVRFSNPTTSFVGGSNWVSVGVGTMGAAGVQTDGSLWSIDWWEVVEPDGSVVPRGLLENAGRMSISIDGHNSKAAHASTNSFAIAVTQARRKLVGKFGVSVTNMNVELEIDPKATQIGTNSDWSAVAAGSMHFVALKRDGTIWGWGQNNDGQLGDRPKEFGNHPFQIGHETDWVAIAAAGNVTVAAKRDGSVWKWGGVNKLTDRGYAKGYIGPVPQETMKLPSGIGRIVTYGWLDIIFCEDGSGWGAGQFPANFLGSGQAVSGWVDGIRLWRNAKWSDVSVNGPTFSAVKRDGTLWRRETMAVRNTGRLPELERVGRRSDWIAATQHGEEILALAKDGTLCRFSNNQHPSYGTLLAPTRRATWSINLLDAGN